MGIYRMTGGQIWSDAGFVPNQEIRVPVNSEGDHTIRLEDTDLITPGVIDFHSHLWSPATISAFGVEEGRMFAEGVIGAVDAGSFGLDNWDHADRYWYGAARTKVRSFLSLLPEGLSVFPPKNPTRPDAIDTNALVQFINRRKQDGRLLGVKVQLGWLNYKSTDTDRQLMAKAREVADRTDTHIMVHISGQCIDLEETVSYLDKGDVVTHIYSGFDHTILDAAGTVKPAVYDALKKGVLFDVGHAGKHFSWYVFQQAYRQGVPFHMLGGDLTVHSWKNREKFKIFDLFHLISGFLNWGVGLDEVFAAVIGSPAQYMGISPQVKEQCLILRRHPSTDYLFDGMGESIPFSFAYRPYIFLNGGNVISRSDRYTQIASKP